MFLVGVLLAMEVQVHMLGILEGKMIGWWQILSLTLLVGELVGLELGLLEGDVLGLELGSLSLGWIGARVKTDVPGWSDACNGSAGAYWIVPNV